MVCGCCCNDQKPGQCDCICAEVLPPEGDAKEEIVTHTHEHYHEHYEAPVAQNRFVRETGHPEYV